MDRRVFGAKSPDTLGTMANLAGTLYFAKRYGEAEKLAVEALEATQQVLGPEHLNTLQNRTILFAILAEERKYAQAEKLGRETLEIQRRSLGPEHPETALTLYNLGGLAALQGYKDDALTLLRDAVDHGLTPSYDLALESDPDHKILVGDPRFAALAAHAKEKASAAQKQN